MLFQTDFLLKGTYLTTSNDLRIAPRNLLNVWLRGKDLEYSGNVFHRIDTHLSTGALVAGQASTAPFSVGFDVVQDDVRATIR